MKSDLPFKKQRQIAIEALHRTCYGKFAKSCYDQLIKNGCLSKKQIKALKNAGVRAYPADEHDDPMDDIFSLDYNDFDPFDP